MAPAGVYSSDVAFSPSVKAVQTRKGSRSAYSRMEEGGSWETRITPDLAAFIVAQRSLLLTTANLVGQPYIQHRGGPPGFLRVVDEHTLAFADFVGNRQYITLGNARRYNYRLTSKGIDLAPVMVEIILWSTRHENTDAPAHIVRAMSSQRRRFLADIRKSWAAYQ